MPQSPPSDSDGSGFAGFLVKQGGARGGFKTWKRRWFVIKRDCLYYYKTCPEKDGDDSPLLGVLPLHQAKVIQVPETLLTDLSMHEATVCFECNRSFNFITKKKQCKRCLRVFCKSCVSCKVSVPSAGFNKSLKVCNDCYHTIVHSRETNGITDIFHADAAVTEETKVPEKIARIHGLECELQFHVVTPERDLRLKAENEADCREWIAQLESAIERRHQRLDGMESRTPSVHVENWEIDYSALTIVEKIGEGAFGEVFKGRLWGTDVAIKKIKNKDSITSENLDDLKKEIAILSTLRHPNVVLYIGACTVPPNVCIVTEWCDRGSLFDVIYSKQETIDTKKAVNIAIGIAQGMSYLHSLDRKIIHRDLKSQNILLDANFAVKVADFGLSYMRDDVVHPTPLLESQGGRYGVFGTPEWMAPEVMEGEAYNEKVDVYSFGVVFTEMLARQIPLRDQYNIVSYLDVFEAVLEDGARPTIPSWTGEKLHRTIENCLDRDPNRRPTFMQIIARLAHAFHLCNRDIFQLYDVPRLHGMLSSDRIKLVAIAAKEIAGAREQSQACDRCGHDAAPFRYLEREELLKFVPELLNIVNEGSAEIATLCCQAILALRNCIADHTHRMRWSTKILQNRGLSMLLAHLKNPNRKLQKVSKQILLEMAPDIIGPQRKAIEELNSKTTKSLEALLNEEMIVLNRKLEQDRAQMESKKRLLHHLRSNQTHGARTFSRDVCNQKNLVLADALYGDVLQDDFLAPTISVIKSPEPLSDDLKNFLVSRSLPDSLTDNALLFDPVHGRWSLAFFLLLERKIYIFTSQTEADPNNPLSLIEIPEDISADKVWLARKGSKPHCLHICIGDKTFVFCTRSRFQSQIWARLLLPEMFPVPEAAPSIASVNSSQLLEMVDTLPPVHSVPAELMEQLEGENVHQFGWLLAFDEQINVWYPTFAVAFGSLHVRLFEGPRELLQYEIGHIHLSDSTAVGGHISAWTGDDEWSKRLFSIDDGKKNHSFCAATSGERELWLSKLKESYEQDNLVVNSSEIVLQTLPADLRSVFDKDKGAPHTPNRNSPQQNIIVNAFSDDEDTSIEQMREEDIRQVLGMWNSPSQQLVDKYGKCIKHGYLHKRGAFRKNWKWRYFYLSGKELRYFPSHSSRPAECLGTIYTATASGKGFNVFRDTTKRDGLCFGIENPNRTWLFAALDDQTVQDWITAVESARLTSPSTISN